MTWIIHLLILSHNFNNQLYKINANTLKAATKHSIRQLVLLDY